MPWRGYITGGGGKADYVFGSAAAASYFWLEPLETVSEIAALVLPILGVIVLLIRGYFDLKSRLFNGK